MTMSRPAPAPTAVARYAQTVHAAAPAGHHVVSPLGAWLVLALAGLATGDAQQHDERLRAALGLSPEDAGALATRLLAAPHPAVAAAVGLWWRADARTDRLAAYADRLPRSATREVLTDQDRLDAWARACSLGMIDRFPLQLTDDLLLVLASALATRVRWLRPFDVVPSSELGGAYAAAVPAALRSVQGHDVRLVQTAAGLVAAHVAASGDGLAVVSVLGAPDADRANVLAAAHEVALELQGGRIGAVVSLFDVPAGRSELGDVSEDAVVVEGGPARREEGIAVLPAWRARTGLDLLDGPTGPGFAAAGQVLARLLPSRPMRLAARQVAVASYGREGFEAAAITSIGVRAVALREPREVPRRTLRVRFDRPYAAVAVAVPPPGDDIDIGIDAAWYGLPVFSAWITEPAEP
jgi:hypothetical protein